MSGGQKRRIAIAGVIAMQPRVLILDEPTAGLDPKGRDDILSNIKRLKEEYNMTIILVSHSMDDVAELVDRLIVMYKGKNILQGTPKEVFRNIDTLESIGLAVPQVTYLVRELNKRGFNLDEDIITVAEAKNALIKALRRENR